MYYNYLDMNNKKIINYIYIYIMIIIIMMLFLIILFITYYYKTYYETIGKIIKKDDDYYLDIIISIENSKIIVNNNILYINGKKYPYKIYNIDNEVFIYKNIPSQNIRLKINLEKMYHHNNLFIKVKFIKENKLMYKYIL